MHATLAATEAATYLGWPIPREAWTGHASGHATCRLSSGGQLRYDVRSEQLTAAVPCAAGAWHVVTLRHADDLEQIAAAAQACTVDHLEVIRVTRIHQLAAEYRAARTACDCGACCEQCGHEPDCIRHEINTPEGIIATDAPGPDGDE
jgi:hypothetical protein